jgi:hypothetical protein
MEIKKPPDKYRTSKCSLKSIIKDDLIIPKLFDAMMRTHKIVIHTYQFLRLWILNKYNNKLIIPTISDDTIKMAFKSLVEESSGPKPKGSNLDLFNEFNIFYEETYKHLNYDTKIDAVNLSQILSYMSIDMLTNIENNIKLHFISYIKRFVNSSYKKNNMELIENTKKGDKTKLRKELNKDLYQIKEDLINDTLKSDVKYHEWINEHKQNILPKEYKNSYEFDIQNNPQKYIKYMIYMCNELEKLETKSFQFFPMRTDIIPKYIPIDTASLIDLFVTKDKNSYFLDIENKKNEIWNKYFKLNDNVFNQNKYSFDYRISTDCFSVSIQLIHDSLIESEKIKKINMKNKKNETKEACKNMTQQEKELYKIKLEENKEKIQLDKKLKNKEERDKNKAEFKKLPKEEQLKIKQEKMKAKQIEFPYLEDLTDEQLKDLIISNWNVNDPGHRDLIHMKKILNNGDEITFNYSNKEHMTHTKRLKYQRLIKNYKDKNDISTTENELSKYNSKSCDFEKFKNYVTNKNRLNKILLDKYKQDIFRKYKWYSYINRKRSETGLVKKIKQTFGKDVNILYGDYSAKGRLHFISTPNIGLKRKLGEYFNVYNLDEFRTSCLSCKTEERCENLYIPDKKGVTRKIHSILTYQMENKRIGCINRDNNSVNNMIKLVKYYFEHKDRPEKYKRSYKLE